MKKTDSLTIKNRLEVIRYILATSWKIRKTSLLGYGFGAMLEIGGMLGSIYATAKLGGLLANFITTSQTDGIWFWLGVDIATLLITAMGFVIMSYFQRMLYFSFVTHSTSALLGALCRLDIADFYDKDMRNNLNKIGGSYIWQLPNLADACLTLLYGIARFIAITFVVAQITWWLVPLIALFLVPSLISESRMAKMQWFVWDSKGDFRHVFWGLENIIKQAKGQFELRVSQATNFVLNKVNSMNREFYGEQEVKYKRATRFVVPTKILEVIGPAIGSIVLVLQFLAREISFERYLFLTGALLRVGGALNNVFSTLTRMEEGVQFAHDYLKLIKRQPTIVDLPDAKTIEGGTSPRIEFKNVSFSYPGKSHQVFKDLNLVINPGEHVALVGENGAGKSTFIKLLLRFYLPDTGEVLVNGIDIRNIAIESLYTQLATLFQDFNEYPLSVAENIEIGRSEQKANKKLLEAAGKFGSVNEFIKSYKFGWDTVLDASFTKGVEPSGGQWQRVALARAFYRNANMIILDEPTSAIDAAAEYDIFNNIFKHYKDKTALIVSHRFSTVRRADRIIVLDNGAVLEQGSHLELMKTKGVYYNLFTKQAEGYRD